MTDTIAIMGALKKEGALVVESLDNVTNEQIGGIEIHRGTYAPTNQTIIVTVAGMGTVNAAATAQLLISVYGAQTILFSGIAGGLNKRLHIGDVVIGKHLYYLDTDSSLLAESAPHLEEFSSTESLINAAVHVLDKRGLIKIPLSESNTYKDRVTHTQNYAAVPNNPTSSTQNILSQPSYLVGAIATGNKFVTGISMQQEALRQTHADCVEMEGTAVAHICAKNGCKCLVLRTISDNCDEAYDAICNRELDLEEYARNASSMVLSILNVI